MLDLGNHHQSPEQQRAADAARSRRSVEKEHMGRDHESAACPNVNMCFHVRHAYQIHVLILPVCTGIRKEGLRWIANPHPRAFCLLEIKRRDKRFSRENLQTGTAAFKIAQAVLYRNSNKCSNAVIWIYYGSCKLLAVRVLTRMLCYKEVPMPRILWGLV